MMRAMTDRLAREIEGLGPWFHNLHLPGGLQTMPNHHFGDFPACKWAQFRDALPQDLTGWSALDIGCNAGFYTFELARRGARVCGLDLNPHYLRQARWAANELGMAGQVEFLQAQIYDLARSGRRFDLILFMGVFYHLRYPLLALDILGAMQPRLMVFQTLMLPGEDIAEASHWDVDFQHRHMLAATDWPHVAFVENTFCRDPTNWWVPNHGAVMAMLRSAGFEVIARPGEEIYLCRSNMALPTAQWNHDELRAAAGMPRH